MVKKIKINNDETLNNNWGFGELTRKKVIGQIKIANKKNLFFFAEKTGISANNPENWTIPPNCSAPNDKPIAIIISPIDTSVLFIGNISLWKLPFLKISSAPEKW